MSQPLSQDALDQLFTKARSYNGYLAQPGRVAASRDLGFDENWTDVGEYASGAARVVCQSSGEGCSGSRGEWHECSENPRRTRDGNHRHGHGISRALAGVLSTQCECAQLFTDRQARETAAFRNSSLQEVYFIMAARALGLDTGPMSGFNNAAIDKEFFAESPHVKSNFIATLGYGDPNTVFGRLPRPSFERFNRTL